MPLPWGTMVGSGVLFLSQGWGTHHTPALAQGSGTHCRAGAAPFGPRGCRVTAQYYLNPQACAGSHSALGAAPWDAVAR